MSPVFNPHAFLTYPMLTWFFMGWRAWSRGAGSTPSGLLINGLVALIIGLAALIGDVAFKSYMGNIGYVVIAILAIILIIMGAIRTARALRTGRAS